MYNLPCPNCGSELAYLEQYRRHYCYACGRYAPDGYGERGAKACPTCTGVLAYIVAYERYFCYRCGAYPAVDAPLSSRYETAAPSGPGSAPEPTTAVQATSVVTSMEPESSHGTVEEEIQEEAGPEDDRRPLDREELDTAKKPLLMDLCRQYGLTATGTKEELRQRLLSYLDELEGASAPEEIPVEEEISTADDTQYEETAEEPGARQDATQGENEQESEPQGAAADSSPTYDVYEEPVEYARIESGSPSTTAFTVEVPQTQETIAPERTRQVARAEHSCPTCGSELSFISQYNRWYCYRCRAYAPTKKARFACPTCGSSLRWITQYARWWCDACRRYAPADLPRPEGALAAAPTVGARAATRTVTTAIEHRHRSPGGGIGLVVFGIFLFILYELLVDLPTYLAVDPGVALTADLAFGLRFFAFFFVAVGAIMGLSAVRDRR